MDLNRGHQLHLDPGHQLDLNPGHQLDLNRGHQLDVNLGHQLDLNRGHQLDLNGGHQLDPERGHQARTLRRQLCGGSAMAPGPQSGGHLRTYVNTMRTSTMRTLFGEKSWQATHFVLARCNYSMIT